MEEPRIELEEIDRLYERLSKEFDLNMPDYAVFVREPMKVGSITVGIPKQIGGNLCENHTKRFFFDANVDGTYLGSEDLIELIADSQHKASIFTCLEEFLHYRNAHKKITMTHNEVKKEAKELMEKLAELEKDS